MKILAIRGENLASLEGAFEIDFRQEPLRSAGIFAITGHTGAGKSTLLDALCLALFEKIPRNRNVSKGIKIEDVKGNQIAQQDSRTILRRGTSSGYAEVDFISLGGETFRARWSVRRSYNKVDGSLQDTVYQVTNLTTEVPLGGTKTELLAQVSTLIGLNFDQFTRAVLLAQGDFATFLKAGPNEKAELLEKLTGTGIYSRISTSVFLKEKEARTDLEMIRERIKGLELCSEEDLVKFNDEKQVLTEQLVSLEQSKKLLEVKVEWLKEKGVRTQDVLEATRMLATAQRGVDEAKPRVEYLERIDQVQAIRTDYTTWMTSTKQLQENEAKLVQQQRELAQEVKALREIDSNLETSTKQQQSLQEESNQARPLLKQARSLDVRIGELKKQLERAQKEIDTLTKEQSDTKKWIAQTRQHLILSTKKIEKINVWYKSHQGYAEAVTNAGLVSNQLTSASETLQNGKTYTATIKQEEIALLADTKDLEMQQKEAERLNKLLPEEVLILRKELVEGQPCPVCGNTHHLVRAVKEANGLKEESLSKAKKNVAIRIDRLTKDIESRNGRVIRNTSLRDRYRQQYTETMEQLGKWLLDIPEWRKRFEAGTLQATLREVTNQWTTYDKELIAINEAVTKEETALELKEESLALALAQMQTKNQAYDVLLREYTALLNERKKLFDGKSADVVEGAFEKREKVLILALQKLQTDREKIASQKDKVDGALAQIKETIAKNQLQQGEAKQVVLAWLESMNGAFTLDMLAELLAKDAAWISTERTSLKRLDTHRATVNATLLERKDKLAVHLKKEVKPVDEESEELLQEALTTCLSSIEKTRHRENEVQRLLMNHQENKKKVTRYKKEEEKKGVLANNWGKLNQLFGSSTGTKFKVLAQGYTLDVLLAYANKHLKELTKRYTLQRIGNTLGLQVVDLDMLGEVRTVHSLSGGESFLISLALALGLSSLSSNRMRVESLFIDEGFGSLDGHTLRVALDALERLQTQGRKIGVISHVVEMTERIATQIQVVKAANGRSRIEIVG